MQKNFMKLLVKSEIDNDGKNMITRFINVEIDSLQKVIKSDNKLSVPQQVQALNCVSYFLDTMKEEIEKKSVDVYQMRVVCNNFIPLWESVRTDQSCDRIIGELGIKSANIMAVVFKDYPQGAKIKNMATLKSLERSPDKIMNFLGSAPGFVFKDTLLYIFANTQPERFINAAQGTKDPELLKTIQQHSSPLIKTLLSIANEKNFKNYLPFVSLLAQNKITLAEIDKVRAVPSDYYKLIVDAELDNQADAVEGKIPDRKSVV